MIGEHFYHRSIKKVIATFGSLFSDVTIKTGKGGFIQVPIHYAQKQKFVEVLSNNEDVRNMYTDVGLPVLGFEVVNYAYNPEKMTNPLNVQNKIIEKDNVTFMFTSVPYTIGIELYLATNTLDELYQIIEQIAPFFAPQLTVTINDKDLYDLKTNITFDLNSVSQDIQYESSFDEKRIILANFSFSAHTKFHSNPRSIQRIKDVIINMSEKDHDELFDKLVGHRDNADEEFTWSK